MDRGLLRSGKRTQYDPAAMGKVLDIAGQVAAGVQHLHARGIVHGGARFDVVPAAQPARAPTGQGPQLTNARVQNPVMRRSAV